MAGTPKVTYKNSIFINCPFDPDYTPILHAIVFTAQDLGFAARIASEKDDSGENRLQKIMDIMGECKYGVHDISRTELNAKGLPRFNMPFELGLFLGCKRYGVGKHKSKVTLTLDSDKYRYLDFFTDLRGFDIKSHENSAEKAVTAVRAWLGPTPERTKQHGPEEIWKRYQLFRVDLSDICNNQKTTPETLTFTELVQIMRRFIIKLDSAV